MNFNFWLFACVFVVALEYETQAKLYRCFEAEREHVRLAECRP